MGWGVFGAWGFAVSLPKQLTKADTENSVSFIPHDGHLTQRPGPTGWCCSSVGFGSAAESQQENITGHSAVSNVAGSLRLLSLWRSRKPSE